MTMRGLGRAISRNSSTILTVIGLIGMGVAGALAIEATVITERECEEEWRDLPEEVKDDKDDFTLGEKLRIGFKYYIPAVVTFVGATICIVLGHRKILKDFKEMAGLYSAAESAAFAYRNKMFDSLPKKKAEEIDAAVAKNYIREHPQTRSNTVETRFDPSSEEVIRFCDGLSGRYFYSTIEFVKNALSDFNIRLNDGPQTVNTLYEIMDLPTVELGDYGGWTKDSEGDNLEWVMYPIEDERHHPCMYVKPYKKVIEIARLRAR